MGKLRQLISVRPVLLHDIAVLACRAPRPATGALASCCAIEYGGGEEAAILDAYAAAGHKIAAARVGQRLRNGLRFFVLHRGSELIASTWIVCGASRYIDEVNWALSVADDAFWVRDVFVAPAWRGRRVFGALVAAIATQHVVPCRSIWSDVDWANAPSMQAHRSAGFEVWARLRALELFGRLRLRCAAPAWSPPPYDIAPGSPIVWLGGSILRRHAALIA